MRQRSLFWWLFVISFLSTGFGLTGLLVAMQLLPEVGWLPWVFGPLWFVGLPLLIGTTIVWGVSRVKARWRTKPTDRLAAAESPSQIQSRSKKKALTSVQIGGCVGAAATCLFLLAVRDWSRPIGGQGGVGGTAFPPPLTVLSVTFSSDFLLGGWSAIGGLVGMAVIALVSTGRRRKRCATKNETANGKSLE